MQNRKTIEGNEQESATNLFDQCQAYLKQGNDEKAKEILERVLTIQTKDLRGDTLDLAETLKAMGDLLLREGQLDGASDKLNRALEIQLKELGENHVCTSNTYEGIGHVFFAQHNDQKAEEMFRQALDIRLATQGEKHGDTASTYKNIGDVSLSQGNFEKAEEMFRKALDINLEILPKTHPDVTNLYHDIAKSLRFQRKFSEATNIARLVLETVLVVHGEDHLDVVKAYLGISGLLGDQNRNHDGLQMLDKSIEICSRLQGQGQGDFDIHVLINALAMKAICLQKLGNIQGSTEVLTNILTITKETQGEMHSSTGDTYEELAAAYRRQEMPELALEACGKAINIRKATLGNDHFLTKNLRASLKLIRREKQAKELNEQGLAMKAQGDSEKAMQLFHEALDIYTEIVATSSTGHHKLVKLAEVHGSKMAAIHENISAIKVQQGLLEDGIAASAEALKIRRRVHGDDHADTKARMEAHRSLLKRLLENQSQ